MKKRIQRFIETMKHVRIRSVIYALAALLVTAAIAAFVGLKIHTMLKENLYLRGGSTPRKRPWNTIATCSPAWIS